MFDKNDDNLFQIENDTPCQLKRKFNRKAPKHSDYVFRKDKYQENKYFKQKQQKNDYVLHQEVPNQSQPETPSQDQNDMFIATDLFQFGDNEDNQQMPEMQKPKQLDAFYEQAIQGIDDGGCVHDSHPQNSENQNDFQNSNVRLKVNYNTVNQSKKKIQDNHSKKDIFSKKRTSSQLGNKSRKSIQQNVQPHKFESTLQPYIHEDYQNEEIKGIKIITNPDTENSTIQITDKRQFIFSPLPPGIKLKCKLRRSTNFFNMLTPQYDLYISNGLKHVISAKKYSMSNHQVFKVSTEIGKYQLPHCVGTIRSNTLHNQYWMIGVEEEIRKKQIYSKLYAVISYQKLKKGKKQREMKAVLTPYLKNYAVMIESKRNNLILSEIEQQLDIIIHSLSTEQNQASQKNFVMVDNEDEDYQYIRLQKNSDQLFDLQIQHPLSPIQAFSIALTRFDAQLK